VRLGGGSVVEDRMGRRLGRDSGSPPNGLVSKAPKLIHGASQLEGTAVCHCLLRDVAVVVVWQWVMVTAVVRR
jgi:hypothetical protein